MTLAWPWPQIVALILLVLQCFGGVFEVVHRGAWAKLIVAVAGSAGWATLLHFGGFW